LINSFIEQTIKMRCSLLCSFLALLALSTNVSATSYYFSASTGRDSNTGTSPSSPWQTTGKFNDALSNRMSPGDMVYFCQGDVWLYAHLSVNSHGVTFDSYQCRQGQTDKPVISTAVQPATGSWRRVGTSDILVTNFDQSVMSSGVQAVWVDNVRYVTARFPALLNPVNTMTVGQTTWGLDGEFLRASRVDGNTIYSNDINQGTDYWKGAAIYVRVLNYAYLQFNVVASGPGFVTLHAAPGNAAGFFLTYTSDVSAANTHLQVNNAGEFSFDTKTGLMYLYPLNSGVASRIISGAQPVSVLMNGLPAPIVVQGGIRDVVIRNMAFRWSAAGIQTLSNGALTISRNDVLNVAGYGIFTQRVGAITIDNNYVFDAESSCISSQTTTKVTLNTVRQCGLYAGLGVWQATNGINCAGGECSYNSVNLVGYIGIAPTQRAFVNSNKIDWAMMTLNDGGAIYGYGSGMAGVSLYSNIVTNVVGNYASWQQWQIAPCYYLDATSYVQLYNNTCTSAPSCVQMNAGNGHLVFSNVCNAPGMYINQAVAPSTFIGNLVATTGTNTNLQNSLHRVQAPDRNTYNDIMTTADNVYCIPQGADRNYLFQMVKQGLNVRYYAFEDWKNAVLPSAPAWERGTAVYTSCRGLRATFVGNEISTLPGDISSKSSNNMLAVEVAVPIVLVVAVLIAIVVGFAYRVHRSKTVQTQEPAITEIEIPQSSPTSSSVSSFSRMSSPRDSSVIMV
jgi:hypothetical protein